MLAAWLALHFFVFNKPVSFITRCTRILRFYFIAHLFLVFWSLFNGISLAQFISALADAEFNKTGLQLSSTAFTEAVVFLVVDVVLYLVLLWYLDNVYVGT